MTGVQTYNGHKVTCASIEDPVVDLALAGETVDVLYSDPPWGDGNLKYWATMNRKMTGTDNAPLDYASLLGRIRELAERYVRGWVFIETGPRWVTEVVDWMSEFTQLVGVQNTTYQAGSKLLPCSLVSGTTTPDAPPFTANVEGLRGAAFATAVVADVGRPGGVVFDPCCGMGYTAAAALAADMRFIGNEVNAKRLAKTIARLQ